MRKEQRAFTLAEMLIAIAILTVLVLIITRLLNTALSVTAISTKRIDVNSEMRPLFNRMAVDLAQMIKRSDLSAYVKISPNPEAGNDLIAFFSLVDGYYPTTGNEEKHQSQTTLISYRINSRYQLERMAKALAFAGQTSSPPLIFGSANTLSATWPTAASRTDDDSDYNVIAPHVFRFEYYYVLRNGGAVSDSPWPNIAAVNMRDVAAIAVNVAVIDPKSRTLLSNGDIASLASQMQDYDVSMGTTGLLAQWQSVVATNATVPRSALSGIRLHQRIFPL